VEKSIKPHQIFFTTSFFFLIGVALKSIGAGISIIFIALAIAGAFFFLKKAKDKNKYLIYAFLTIFILFGAVYYTAHDLSFQQTVPQFNKSREMTGVVMNDPEIKEGSLDFYVKFKNTKLLIRTDKYPEIHYGDKLRVVGEIQEPFYEGYKKYLAKEGVSGIMYYPNVERIGSGHGSFIKTTLYSLKNKIGEVYKKVAPPLQAAFLNGITLGGYEGFSESFKNAMSLSGTTHLVALSGYNITIIIVVCTAVFLSIFSKKTAYFLTTFFIIGFVIMTGGEASVVRAAIMGVLVLLARSSGGMYDVKNSIMLSALVMIIINPKVLVFDVGFQLSFLALLGIVYLRKPLAKLLKLNEGTSFLSWKDNLLTTASAQLAVAPILISNFGSFSPLSLLANITILELIPVTMFLGFLTAVFSLFSYYAALFVGWITIPLLFFETGLIKFFAKISVPLSFDLGVFGITAYYLLVIAFIKHYEKY